LIANPTIKLFGGDGVIHEKLAINWHEKQFQIGPHSFFQTNTTWAQVLFDYAYSLMENTGGLLLDLYCGAWTIGQCFSDVFDEIVGVDIVEQSIENAYTNLKLNHITNAQYYAWRAEDVVTGLKDLDKLTTVIIDPPREWLHSKVINFINELVKKQKFQLIYISCNPVTMARDCAMMIENGWKVDTLQPVDMFPHTHHVETVGSLTFVG
jgi:23S rRNA (uracil1939-C5)-methyltransferase